MTTTDYIVENIPKTFRTYTKLPKGKKSLIGLPYPFTSPCINGMFREMYYWDTYFTNKGLLLANMNGQAANNVRDFMFLLKTYGKIPNGNRMDYLSRSQPPFFGLMLDDVLRQGEISVDDAFKALETEYDFWMQRRIAPDGLNRYGCDLPKEQLKRKLHVASYRKRTGNMVAYTAENAENILCECESGWDFSPRFSMECAFCNPVDLNCLLYKDEILLSEWAEKSGNNDKSETYAEIAADRKAKIIALMCKDGIYYDYNYRKGEICGVVSCASLFPYFVGIDDNTENFEKVLGMLERKFGVVACDSDKSRYQWSAPNSWAPLNYIAIKAAENLSLENVALRLSEKYVSAIDGLFEKTGKLWEKYNAESGEIDSDSEYGTPEMLGWTAGVYLVCKDYISRRNTSGNN